MNCKYHKDKQSEYVCSICNSPICEECMTEVRGKKVCNGCINKNLFGQKAAQRDISRFWSFLFSLGPGCGQMYMGLMNRGLQLLTIFGTAFLLCFLIEEMALPFMGIAWCYSFFDSLNLRKQIILGQSVEDKLIYQMDMKKININKKYIGFVLVVLGSLRVLKNITHTLANMIEDIFDCNIPTYWIYDIYDNIIPLGFLILGIMLIKKSKKVVNLEKEINKEITSQE